MEDIRIFRNNFEVQELNSLINRHRFRMYHHDLGEPAPEPEPEPEPQLRVINHYDFINTSSLTSLGYGGTTLQSNGTATNGTYGLNLPTSSTAGGANYLYSDGFKLGGDFTISIWFKIHGSASPGGNNLINFGNYGTTNSEYNDSNLEYAFGIKIGESYSTSEDWVGLTPFFYDKDGELVSTYSVDNNDPNSKFGCFVNEWSHAVLSINRQFVNFYVNNTLVSVIETPDVLKREYLRQSHYYGRPDSSSDENGITFGQITFYNYTFTSSDTSLLYSKNYNYDIR